MTGITIFMDSFAVLYATVLTCLCTYRTGVFNIAIQSAILNSGFAFTLVIFKGHNVWLAILAALAAGLVTSVAFALLVTILELEQIVSGIALNIVSWGLTTFITQDHEKSQSLRLPDTTSANVYTKYTLLFLLSITSALAIYVLVWSKFAPRLKAVEENSYVSWLCDLPIRTYRIYSVCIGGVFASLGGAYLSVRLGGFDNNQWISGKNFVALAIVVATRGNILWSVVGALVFSAVDLLQVYPQISDSIPNQISEILPYVLVIVLFCVFGYSRQSKPSKPSESPT